MCSHVEISMTFITDLHQLMLAAACCLWLVLLGQMCGTFFTHVPASLSKQQRTCIVLAVYPVAAVWEGRVLCSSVSGRWGQGEGKGRGHHSHIARCMFEYVLDVLTAAWTWKITNGNDSPIKEQQHLHEPLQPIAACVCTTDAPQSGVHSLESTVWSPRPWIIKEESRENMRIFKALSQRSFSGKLIQIPVTQIKESWI